ncbi:MAG: polyprenol monophosphomannose synthase [Acidobacteriota bacterium]
MKALIIIPTYNEAENIENLIKEIFNLKIQDVELSVLVVDDNSQDGTSEIVEKLMKENKNIFLIKRERKSGLGSAYIRGFKYALEKNFDFAFEMDADFSHKPSYIPDFLNEIKNNDLVLGSRYIEEGGISNWGIIRRFISRVGNIYAKLILGIPVNDLTGGFKCFRSSVLRNLELDRISSDGYCFQIEVNYLCYRKGFKIKEIPIMFQEREKGKSKISKRIIWEAIWKVWSIKIASFFN